MKKEADIKRKGLKLPETKFLGDWHFDKNINSVEYLDEKGVRLGIEVKKRILRTRSPFQEIEIIDTKLFGRTLVLDSILQTTEKDEFLYHEMFVHPAMILHKNPQQVLIIGGGDGGVLRETLKYPSVEKIFLVEIDKKVVELCQKYLPSLSKGAFRDPRVKMVFSDGFEFVKNYHNFFDVIVVDSSDPIGPAKILFTDNFYQNVWVALKKDGVAVIQAGVSSPLFKNEVPQNIEGILKKFFKTIETRFVFVPSYNGLERFILASKKKINKISPKDIEAKFKKLRLLTKYYTPEIHFASKIVPPCLL